jgi:hypothetical protein
LLCRALFPIVLSAPGKVILWFPHFSNGVRCFADQLGGGKRGSILLIAAPFGFFAGLMSFRRTAGLDFFGCLDDLDFISVVLSLIAVFPD